MHPYSKSKLIEDESSEPTANSRPDMTNLNASDAETTSIDGTVISRRSASYNMNNSNNEHFNVIRTRKAS